MKVIMPESGSFVLDMNTINKIDKALYEKTEKQEIILEMPAFSVRSNKELIEILKSLGIRRAFDSKKAQFEPITGASDLFINKLFQEAVVTVDSRGTSAAAVTLVAMDGAAGPDDTPVIKTVTIDKPFYFIIEEKSSGIILFMGQVNKL